MITLKILKNRHCTMCGEKEKYIRELRIDDPASITGNTTYIRLCNNCCLSKIMVREKQLKDGKHTFCRNGLYDFASEQA